MPRPCEQVCRCKFVEPALTPQLPEWSGEGAPPPAVLAQQAEGSGAASEAVVDLVTRLRRRVDSDVMVHDLLEGRTTVLHR